MAPVLFGAIDDHSRLLCHAQWYLAENSENIAHGLSQAFQKAGLPRAALSDNGTAMTSAEIDQGLSRLGVHHARTIPYTPEANGKIENFWNAVEDRLLAMLENIPDLTLETLNRITQVWVAEDYNNRLHSEIKTTPIDRFVNSPSLMRDRPETERLKLAFTRSDNRAVRQSDGTISLGNRRFEIPNRYRHFARIDIRYASWDLTHVYHANSMLELPASA